MALSRPLVAMNLSTSSPTTMPGTAVPQKQIWHTSPPPPRISRMLLFLPPFLIAFPISIALVVLEQLAIGLLDSHRDTDNSDFDTIDTDAHIAYDVDLNHKPTTFILWTSTITVALSVLAALAFWELRSGHERRARIWAFTNIGVTLGNVAFAIACTFSVFEAQKLDRNSRIVDLANVPTIVAGTRETVMCTLKAMPGKHDWARTGCGFAVC
jgi:hypothetical protein